MSRIEKLAVAVLLISVLIGGFLFIDFTGSGLTNYEEIRNGANPLVEDTDGDGLNDYEEISNYGTNPSNNDTDGDGLSDYEEVSVYETSPTDMDSLGNGLSDYEEVREFDTDPLKADTDEDGLDDYMEVTMHSTSPTDADTDNDGLNDSAEINLYETSPTTADSDEDGLEDGAEINTYNTDPLEADTDSDGLTDGEEINRYGTDPRLQDTTGDGLNDGRQVSEYNTDPSLNDTDGDGLSDYDEINIHNTDPLKEDTNGDGLTDYVKVKNDLDPLAFDTSGDGFSDFYSVQNDHMDPDRRSIMVQVSYMNGVSVPNEKLDRIESEFENSPVENFDLNFVVDEQSIPRKSQITIQSYYENYYSDDIFTNKREGYYHLLLVPDIDESTIESPPRVLGATTLNTDGMIVNELENTRSYGLAIAHELGHQLGLEKTLFDGVDTRDYSGSAYPSTMNYNWRSCLSSGGCMGYNYTYTYSSGDGFDDWQYIHENFRENQPSKIDMECGTEIRCVE